MDKCACCGFPIQEGRRLCPVCDGTSPNPDVILKDGTRLYLKTPHTGDYNLQMSIYDLLNRKEQKQ